MRAMASLLLRVGLVVPVVLSGAGCTPFSAGKLSRRGKSPLRPAQMSPDAVVLEVFFARFPMGDFQANDLLWREIDEQHFSTGQRRELARHGIRIGLVAGQIPVTLSQLLDVEKSTPAQPSRSDPQSVPPAEAGQVNLDDFTSPPHVVRRRMQVRAGRRSEIVASGVYDEMTLLLCEPGGVCGQTYAKAQGLLAVRVLPEHDGRVRLDVVPELHHGDPAQRWVGAQEGIWRLNTSRQKRVLENLAVSATLAPGEILVLAALPDRPGSLGHYFFTDDVSGRPEQKLLLVRLAQTQHDGLFSPAQVLPLDEMEQ